MTDRPDTRPQEHKQIIPTHCPITRNKGSNYYSVSLSPFLHGGAAPIYAPADDPTSDPASGTVPKPKYAGERISKKRLEEIYPSLSVRDKAILSALRHCRYLLTSQVQRLYFTDMVSEVAGQRTARRILRKLHDLGLIASLTRRVGGVRAGSSSLIWYLTEAGERLLRLGDDGPHARKRYLEPSMLFLAHNIAVAECYVRLTEICDGEKLKLCSVELESDCWRAYNSKGKQTTLRPDFFAVTNQDKYEDRWFFEVDLNTEAAATVVKKCRRYHEYYRSGLEQQQHGVFPLTVWIVPDAARKDCLVSHIQAAFEGQLRLFSVITPDELAPLIHQGVEGGVLC